MADYNFKECSVCGHDIPEGGYICPNCSKDQRNFFVRNMGTIVVLILIALAIGYMVKNPPKFLEKKSGPEGRSISTQFFA